MPAWVVVLELIVLTAVILAVGFMAVGDARATLEELNREEE